MFQNPNLSTAQRLQKIRGKAPLGKKFVSASVYIPGGPRRNVKDATVKNQKIAENVQMMHEKWMSEFNTRHAAKTRPCA